MNKRELVEAVAAKLGPDASKRAVEDTINAFTETVAQTLRKGESVQLVGFGTFEARRRGARRARNPQTGETIRVRAATVPAFKPGQGLKDTVGRKRAAAKKSATKATKKSAASKSAGKRAAKKSARKTAKKQ